MKLRWLAITLVVMFLCVGAFTQTYVQNPDYNGAIASQNDTNGGGHSATTYDNFKLGADYDLNAVEWVGSYFNPATQGTITAWTISLWADAAGQPGALLQAFSIPGNGNETFISLNNVGQPTYLYGVPITFALDGDTEYWLSVVPDMDFPPQWGWETGTGGDGISYQDVSGNRTRLTNDLAFGLVATLRTSTPEPETLVLLGSGIVGLIGSRRRKVL